MLHVRMRQVLAALGYPMVELACSCVMCSVGVVGWLSNSKCQSPGGVRVPVKTIFSLYLTVTVVVVKFTSHPASHNLPIETKECVCQVGHNM